MALALTIGERVAALRARVDHVAAAAGRPAGTIAILGVTKTQPRDAVLAAIGAGLTDIGENYLQEARDKYVDLPPVTRHFIGHVQTNKAKAIAGLFDVVQSVDRLEAGLALERAARALGRRLRVLVQVNVSPTERFGVPPAGAAHLAEQLRGEGLTVDGVMAIGPLEGDVDRAFATAREAFEAVGGTTLSLGMSADWERAIALGSTMIRIGTAIFGARPLPERVMV
jgi:pyridoxal phosphate enzyme (YggS family)